MEVSKWTAYDELNIPKQMKALGDLFISWGMNLTDGDHRMHSFMLAICVFKWIELFIGNVKPPRELVRECERMGIIPPAPEACIPVVHEMLTKCPEFKETFEIDVQMMWFEYSDMVER